MFQDDDLAEQIDDEDEDVNLEYFGLNIQHAVREDVCSVCISTINVGDECIITDCNHMFHLDCINPWLNNHHTCPNCRANL
jgi:hypothetical protein